MTADDGVISDACLAHLLLHLPPLLLWQLGPVPAGPGLPEA